MRTSSRKRRSSVNLSKERKDLLSKLLVGDLKKIIEVGVRDWLLELTPLIAELLINKEVLTLVGDRYERDPDKQLYRWGAQDGSVYLLEQQVPFKKPRVRTRGAGSSEIELRMYEELNKKDFLNAQAAAKMLSGLSTRRFPETLEQLLDGRGISRQTISDRGVQEMTIRLEEFQTRSLDGVDILVLFIDGIHLGEEVYIAAVGIDTTGKKHVLGFEAGSTENHGVCRTLLSSLINRGILSAEGGFLCVVDGGTGVRKAINDLYGNRVYVQRCTVHKKRNVNDKLQKKFHKEFIHKFNSAFNKPTLKEAEREFQKVRGWLLTKNERAANSLTEGLRDILTLHRLGIRGVLRRTLSTTNCIESVFSAARYYTRNVKRWRKTEQMDRWIASGLLEAEKKLRRVPGYTQLGKLKQAIRKTA
jgi:Transposase and inactivated derivatives